MIVAYKMTLTSVANFLIESLVPHVRVPTNFQGVNKLSWCSLERKRRKKVFRIQNVGKTLKKKSLILYLTISNETIKVISKHCGIRLLSLSKPIRWLKVLPSLTYPSFYAFISSYCYWPGRRESSIRGCNNSLYSSKSFFAPRMKNRQPFNFLTSKAKKLGLYFSSSVHFALPSPCRHRGSIRKPSKNKVLWLPFNHVKEPQFQRKIVGYYFCTISLFWPVWKMDDFLHTCFLKGFLYAQCSAPLKVNEFL